MNRGILPILLIATAIGLFVLYINPMLQETKELRNTYSQYDTTLEQESQLRQYRDALLAKRNMISDQDMQRLESFLPDNIDNIRLIIDMNNIASQHKIQISGISLTSTVSTQKGRIGDESAIGSVAVTFTVNAQYTVFLKFLNDLQHSGRLMDVESINFSVADSTGSALGGDKYTLTVRTYWLK